MGKSGAEVKQQYSLGAAVQLHEEPVDTEQEEPMAGDDDAKRFGEMLLKSVQDLSRQIEVMGQRFTAVEAR